MDAIAMQQKGNMVIQESNSAPQNQHNALQNQAEAAYSANPHIKFSQNNRIKAENQIKPTQATSQAQSLEQASGNTRPLKMGNGVLQSQGHVIHKQHPISSPINPLNQNQPIYSIETQNDIKSPISTKKESLNFTDQNHTLASPHHDGNSLSSPKSLGHFQNFNITLSPSWAEQRHAFQTSSVAKNQRKARKKRVYQRNLKPQPRSYYNIASLTSAKQGGGASPGQRRDPAQGHFSQLNTRHQSQMQQYQRYTLPLPPHAAPPVTETSHQFENQAACPTQNTLSTQYQNAVGGESGEPTRAGDNGDQGTFSAQRNMGLISHENFMEELKRNQHMKQIHKQLQWQQKFPNNSLNHITTLAMPTQQPGPAGHSVESVDGTTRAHHLGDANAVILNRGKSDAFKSFNNKMIRNRRSNIPTGQHRSLKDINKALRHFTAASQTIDNQLNYQTCQQANDQTAVFLQNQQQNNGVFESTFSKTSNNFHDANQLKFEKINQVGPLDQVPEGYRTPANQAGTFYSKIVVPGAGKFGKSRQESRDGVWKTGRVHGDQGNHTQRAQVARGSIGAQPTVDGQNVSSDACTGVAATVDDTNDPKHLINSGNPFNHTYQIDQQLPSFSLANESTPFNLSPSAKNQSNHGQTTEGLASRTTERDLSIGKLKNIKNVSITIQDSDPRNNLDSQVDHAHQNSLLKSSKIQQKINLAKEVDRIIEEYQQVHMAQATKAKSNDKATSRNEAWHQSFESETLSSLKKRSDDLIGRNYRIHELVQIIEEMREREVVQQEVILQMNADLETSRAQLADLRELVEKNGNQIEPASEDAHLCLQQAIESGQFKDILNSDLKNQIAVLHQQLSSERQEKSRHIGLNSQQSEEIVDLKLKLSKIRKEQVAELNNEREKYKALETKKASVRNLTISLSKTSLQLTKEQENENNDESYIGMTSRDQSQLQGLIESKEFQVNKNEEAIGADSIIATNRTDNHGNDQENLNLWRDRAIEFKLREQQEADKNQLPTERRADQARAPEKTEQEPKGKIQFVNIEDRGTSNEELIARKNYQERSLQANTIIINKHIQKINQCTNLQQIFQKIKACIKEVFQCRIVTILLYYPILSNLYKQEKNTQTEPFTVLNEQFEIIISSKKDKEQLQHFSPDIDKRHIKAGLIKPTEINWPVLSSDCFSQRKILYFMINVQGYSHNNYRCRDGQIMNLLCLMIGPVIERYYLSLRTTACIERSLKIMTEMRPIVGEKNHAMLFHKLKGCLAQLFGFEKAAVLFKQGSGPNLYEISYNSQEELMHLVKHRSYSDTNVFSYPCNMGITGKAVQEKRIVLSNKGEYDKNFAPEVDNFCSAGIITNIVVGPMIDMDGKIRGVVQLFNKLPTNPGEAPQINQQDKDELDSILLALGEIIKTADENYNFDKLCNHVYKSLDTITGDINEKITSQLGQQKDQMRDLESVKIMRGMRFIEQGIAELVEHKQKFIFSGDQLILSRTFQGLGLNVKEDASKSRKLKGRQYDNTVTGLDKKDNVQDHFEMEEYRNENQEEIDAVIDKLKNSR